MRVIVDGLGSQQELLRALAHEDLISRGVIITVSYSLQVDLILKGLVTTIVTWCLALLKHLLPRDCLFGRRENCGCSAPFICLPIGRVFEILRLHHTSFAPL